MARRKVTMRNPVATVKLDRASPIPLYFQLARHLEAEIRGGNLDAGDRLENEVKMAEELGISRPTVRQAFRYLVDKGLVIRQRGQGTVVAEERISRSVGLTSLYDDLATAGLRPTTDVLHNEVIRPSDLVKEQLGLGSGDLVIFLERLRWRNGDPIALMHNYIPTSLLTLSNEMLKHHGLYELMRAASVVPRRATQKMSAKNATASEARLLHQTRGAALLTMERTTYDENDRAIEFAQHAYCASRYYFYSILTTD